LSLFDELSRTADGLSNGERGILRMPARAEPLEPGPAAVANQLINTRPRAIEQERKPRETEDLEARIEALERSQEGGRRWGA
jgi:hypothetical protein